jgi:hypothetical protein
VWFGCSTCESSMDCCDWRKLCDPRTRATIVGCMMISIRLFMFDWKMTVFCRWASKW